MNSWGSVLGQILPAALTISSCWNNLWTRLESATSSEGCDLGTGLSMVADVSCSPGQARPAVFLFTTSHFASFHTRGSTTRTRLGTSPVWAVQPIAFLQNDLQLRGGIKGMQSVTQEGECGILLKKYNPSPAPWPGFRSKQFRWRDVWRETLSQSRDTAFRVPLETSKWTNTLSNSSVMRIQRSLVLV